MRIDLYDLPDGMDDDSIVTVTVGELRSLYHVGWEYGSHDEMPDGLPVEVGPAPWLGDGE